MNERQDGIAFSAHLVKIATQTDGGYRVTIDVSECDKDAIKLLIDSVNELIQVGIVPMRGIK